MKTRLNIKNFRIFDKDGAIFELNPLTILTGCNSSGKSTAVKAIMLLNSFLSQIKEDIDNNNGVELSKYKLDFTQYPINLLGRFDKVINDKSEDRKVTFEYTVYSLVISEDVDVKLVFTVDENDDLKNGYLESVTVSIGGNVFYNSDKKIGKSFCDLNIIKYQSLCFLALEYLYNIQVHLSQGYEFDHKFSKDEYEMYRKELKAYKEKYDSGRISDNDNFNKSLYDNNYTHKRDRYKFLRTIDLSIVEWTQQNGSLFMMPIIEHIDTLTKKDVLSFVDNKLFKEFDTMEISIYQKIFNDYIESDCELFSDYFKSYEDKYLEYLEYEGLMMLLNISPCSLDSNYFYLKQPLCYIDNGELLFSGPGFDTSYNVLDESLSFETLYGFLMLLNDKYCKEESKFYENNESGYKYPQHRHKMYDYLRNVAKLLFEEVLVPYWTGGVEYVSSSTAKISRLYSLEEKDHFTELIKKYFEGKRENAKNKSKGYIADDFTNRWMKKFKVGEKLSIKYDDEGLGATIRLYKNSEDKNGKLLSDEGYGITQLISIMLQIETAILSAKGMYANMPIKSQEEYDDCRKFYYENITICIEEPEIHLHPKYQSLLADMFVEAYQKYNIHFIIETHSEYLIRKLQTMVASKNNELGSGDVSIYYIASNDECDGVDKVRKINIMEDGRLSSPFGTGFFDEADNLAMELLNIKLG